MVRLSGWNMISNYAHHLRIRARNSSAVLDCRCLTVCGPAYLPPGEYDKYGGSLLLVSMSPPWPPVKKRWLLVFGIPVGYRACLMSEEPTVIGVPADSFNETPWCWFDVVLPRRPVCSFLRSIIGWGLDGLLGSCWPGHGWSRSFSALFSSDTSLWSQE